MSRGFYYHWRANCKTQSPTDNGHNVMRTTAIRTIVAIFGLLCGACIILWIGSYTEGYFTCEFAPGTRGHNFFSIQRGTLAVCIDGPAKGAPPKRYTWWLEPYQMFDAVHPPQLRVDDHFSIMLGSSVYPWKWQLQHGFEGYVPLWAAAILFGIVPVLWAFGFFDDKGPKTSNNAFPVDGVSAESRTGEDKKMKRNGAQTTIPVGLTQMACGPNGETNLKNQLRLVEHAAKSGAQIICTQELFRSQYFCQVEDHRFFKLAETIPGPSTDAFASSPKNISVVIIASLFEKRADGPLSQHRRHHRRRRLDPRHLPQDAHPRRPALLREILFHARRHRLSRLANQLRQDRRADLLGSVVPRRRARLTALQGAEILFYPTAIGWHPSGKSRIRRSPARSLGTDPAQPRRRQRLLCLRPNRIGPKKFSDRTASP